MSKFRSTFFSNLRQFIRPSPPPPDFVPPSRWEEVTAKGVGAVMFFWIFYMFRENGAVYLVKLIYMRLTSNIDDDRD